MANNPVAFVDPWGLELVETQLSGVGNAYLDSAMLQRVNAFIAGALSRGVAINFNSAYRTPEEQALLHSNPNAITPAQQSLHSCGFAVDIDYNSLGDIVGGPTGAEQRQILREEAQKAGLLWGGAFSQPDRPHFYHDPYPGGSRQGLIQNATADYNEIRTSAYARTPSYNRKLWMRA